MFPIYSPDDHLPNFQQVCDELYRGGQPTPKGFNQLKDMGVTTIINLRDESRLIDEERLLVNELKLSYVSIPLSPFRAPKDSDIEKFFNSIQRSDGSSFVHCWHGMDRTGTFVSLYRMKEHAWELDIAYAEMLKMGFHEEFIHLRNCVLNFAERIDSF